jgi:hypothetical protein
MAQFKETNTLLTLRSVSMQYNANNTANAMQCNAMQYNAIQCNAIQCKYEVRPSVRNEVSQSFFYFFLFFFGQYDTEVRGMYGTRMSRMDGQVSVFFLVGMYDVTDGQTSFSYFSSDFSSVFYTVK